MKKEWNAPIYAFYKAVPDIGYNNGWRFHNFLCATKAVKGKYDVTWTRKMPNPQATYKNMPSNAGDQKQLMWQTKARMLRRLVMLSRNLAQEVVLSLTVLKGGVRER